MAPKMIYRNFPSNASALHVDEPCNSSSSTVAPSRITTKDVSSLQSQTSKKVAVIIVSAKRSGSSFVGELFNQHPDVFYVFEPLWALDHAALKSKKLNKTFVKNSITILNGTMRCDFHTNHPGELSIKNPFLLKTAKLSRKMGYTDHAVRERICNNFTYVVAKVIRIHDLNNIRPLVEATDIELKVIHLVRDPRPTERSRNRTRPNFNLIRRKGTDEMDEIDLCDTLERNLQFWRNTPPWLKGKYKFVRFEDVASSPQKMAGELYDFVGLTMVAKVEEWIKKHTELKQSNSYAYGTVRNSAEVLESWRRDMDWGLIKKIQNICSKPMEALGYVLFPDVASLHDTHNPSTAQLQHL